jgi:hypothetical protein
VFIAISLISSLIWFLFTFKRARILLAYKGVVLSGYLSAILYSIKESLI